MRKHRRADERSWLVAAYCAALPAVLGIVVAVAVALSGCGSPPPDEHAAQGTPLLHLRCTFGAPTQATCVIMGRTFWCERRSAAWRCDELK